MFAWYRKSSVCFAYLSDVPAHVTAENDSDKTFEKSRWFTRGWTLQELLAPESVIFYGNEWSEYGTRQQLKERISAITNIEEGALENRPYFKIYSVAHRMSWAAHRQTKRVEDMAYCLLGIFEVCMPLLYGEGERAFIRLQEEILRETDDQSIFAWESGRLGARSFLSGMFATSPLCFAGSRHFIRGWRVRNDVPPTVTSRGVRIQCPLVLRGKAVTGFSYLVLDCQDVMCDQFNEEYMAIELYNVRPAPFYCRSQPWELVRIKLTDAERIGAKEVYVQKTVDPDMDPFTLLFPAFP
ncbi:hypothetical protein BO78DRAFT_397930 [Aspergillus sclerotiicarbonarius CBS 121057]|uniref:DUF8212 domain-containing protein n=1 Tax=Aspergillus sclerotiicarbonarius (strain CBS 121057 / IBT 28362) TaxID=1448318 RepID=A0A319EGF1_ASPSB|nr:hypothetical protein BO78DRAFT_397930 [Aspergillus sclerotiicarbonarius CBS 121057]